MKNKVQLITYADRLSGGTLADLHALLNGPLAGVFGGVHILPFFHTIDGADAGFDPIDHTQVDARLGDWVDIAVRHPQGRAYLGSILKHLAESGVTMIRLDAIGYAIKKAGSSCFMMPETFEFIDEFAGIGRELGLEVLVEVHSYYRRQIEI